MEKTNLIEITIIAREKDKVMESLKNIVKVIDDNFCKSIKIIRDIESGLFRLMEDGKPIYGAPASYGETYRKWKQLNDAAKINSITE